MKHFAPCLVALLSIAGAAYAQAPTPTRPTQRSFEHSQMTDVGFGPITDITNGVREVRRIRLRDPYSFLPIPGIEVQRRGDGGVFVRLQYPGWSGQPVAVDRSAWDELVALDAAVFAPPPPAPPRTTSPATPLPPPAICHAWSAVIVADEQRTVSWSECNGQSGSAVDYAKKMVALAMTTRPSCRPPSEDVFFGFSHCFADGGKFDDEALGAKVDAIKAAYSAEPGADILMRSRQAMQKPMRLGDPAWVAGREAIDGFAQSIRRRRTQLYAVSALLNDRRNLSPADAARLDSLARSWSQFLAAQEVNYSQLLKQLADVAP